MDRLLDVNHPFFVPLWRRIAVVVSCVIWLGMEVWGGDGFWGVISGAFLGYSVWALLVKFDPEKAAKGGEKKP